MKKHSLPAVLILSLVIEIFLIIGVVSPVSVNRPSHTRAIARWMLNRSASNERILKLEFAETRRIVAIKRWSLIILLVLNTFGVIMLLKSLSGKKQIERLKNIEVKEIGLDFPE